MRMPENTRIAKPRRFFAARAEQVLGGRIGA
jgi:hypothetical protein